MRKASNKFEDKVGKLSDKWNNLFSFSDSWSLCQHHPWQEPPPPARTSPPGEPQPCLLIGQIIVTPFWLVISQASGDHQWGGHAGWLLHHPRGHHVRHHARRHQDCVGAARYDNNELRKYFIKVWEELPDQHEKLPPGPHSAKEPSQYSWYGENVNLRLEYEWV